MIVEYEEMGDRPAIMTKARKYAPQFARKIAAVLSIEPDWAGKCFVHLDWSDVKQRLPFPYPVLYLAAAKDVGGRQLFLELRFDVDDIFSTEVVTGTILLDLVDDLRRAVDEAVAKGPS